MPELLDDPSEAILDRDAREFAHEFQVDRRRVRAVFDRMVALSSRADSPVGPAWDVRASGAEGCTKWLRSATERLGADAAVTLFEQADLIDMSRRLAAVDYLLRESPFHTLEELADLAELHADLLDRNREALVAIGRPLTTPRYVWPWPRIGNVYPVKHPSGVKMVRTEPPAEIGNTRVDLFATTYTWERPVVDSTGGADARGARERTAGWVPCSYEEAPLIPRLSEADAARLESGRPALIDAEAHVLRRLAQALRERDRANVWQACLGIVTNALLARDAEFYLVVDRVFLGYDVRSGQPDEGSSEWIPAGGLTDLFEVIGHVEKELAIGTFDRTRRSLPAPIADVDLFKVDYRSYYLAIGQPWRADLDRALDLFLALDDQEGSFWEDYQARVNAALEEDFSEEVVTRTRVKRKFAAMFEPHMQTFANLSRAQLELTGVLPTVQVSSPATPAPEPPNLFRKGQGTWTIRYAGKTVHLGHLRGFDLLAYLLRDPGRAYEVEVLDAAIRGNLGPAPDAPGIEELIESGGWRVGSIGDAGVLADERTIRAARIRLRELEYELKVARANGDETTVAIIQSDHAQISRYLSETVDRRGQPRKANDPGEKARVNVRRLMKRAINEIGEVHPTLAAHLEATVRTGYVCIYSPDPLEQVSWTF
jgi:hypothetical protein